MNQKVFLVSAVRTPISVFGGAMRTVKPLDLTRLVILESLIRAGLPKDRVDQVIMGNCMAPVEQNIGRVASLLAGLPYETPGYTLNCACSSSMQAAILGAMTIVQGMAGVVIAGGVESMSNAPYILDSARWGQRLRHMETIDLLWKAMQEYPVGGGMGIAAERLAEKYHLSRLDQDELAASSHRRAVRAIDEGRFRREIAAVEVPLRKGVKVVDTDENPRRDVTVEALSRLKPAFKEEGSVTAGNSSSLNDGAAALLLASEERVKELGLRPMAEIKAFSTKAVDPHYVGIASVPAIRDVLTQTGLGMEDVDLFEVNEAFASYYLACERELGLDRDRTNVNGSGISLGHPVGCTGARLIVTLYHELERQDLRLGVAGLCAGGGVGTAVMLERC